jgi:hypothetical protein
MRNGGIDSFGSYVATVEAARPGVRLICFTTNGSLSPRSPAVFPRTLFVCVYLATFVLLVVSSLIYGR